MAAAMTSRELALVFYMLESGSTLALCALHNKWGQSFFFSSPGEERRCDPRCAPTSPHFGGPPESDACVQHLLRNTCAVSPSTQGEIGRIIPGEPRALARNEPALDDGSRSRVELYDERLHPDVDSFRDLDDRRWVQEIPFSWQEPQLAAVEDACAFGRRNQQLIILGDADGPRPAR